MDPAFPRWIPHAGGIRSRCLVQIPCSCGAEVSHKSCGACGWAIKSVLLGTLFCGGMLGRRPSLLLNRTCPRPYFAGDVWKSATFEPTMTAASSAELPGKRQRMPLGRIFDRNVPQSGTTKDVPNKCPKNVSKVPTLINRPRTPIFEPDDSRRGESVGISKVRRNPQVPSTDMSRFAHTTATTS